MIELVLLLVVGSVERSTKSSVPVSASAALRSLTPLKRTTTTVAGRPDVDDLEGAAVLGIERAVVAKRQRIAGEGLDAQLALDAVRRRRSRPSGRGFGLGIDGRALTLVLTGC